MSSLLDVFIDLLLEFDLPEPEINHTVIAGENQLTFLLAFPRDHIAVREGCAREVATIAGWQVWECETEARARIVCREIAKALQIEPSVLRLDFSRVKSLLESRQLDMARDELEGLQGRITHDHPDWSACEEYRKSIRRAKRQQKSGEAQTSETEVAEIDSSFPELLRQDGARVSKGDLSPYCILGLFSPLDESMSTVDAVWVATVSDMGIDAWPACLEGNPAYEADPSWETVETEVELLQGVLTRIEGRSTFVWDLPKVQLLLQNWHHRSRGSGLPEGCYLMGLQELSQVAFPVAHRTDHPEALCKQLKLEFRDEMGNGGPLAAMVMLVGRCVQVLSTLPDEQRAVLRTVFSLSPGGGKIENLQLFGDERGAMPGMPLHEAWLDVFLPPAKVQGEQGYLEMLLAYYQQLNPPVRQSKGQRGVINLETLDFLKKGGFMEQVSSFPYRVRENQITFSQMIEDALEEKRPYVLEAGTGIGKTIGYLVPALLSGKHTYISTHTKSLQDQAWSKDVPLVIKALEAAGIERKVSILKGKGNYVCLQTVADLLESPQEFINSNRDIFFVAALMNWLLVTETGWLGEIEHFGNGRLLKLLGRDQAAPKLQDRWADADPHTKAKEAAARSDVVVTNHSYVFSVANTIEPEKSVIETLILDEAHNVEDVVTEVLTLHFRPWALLRVIESVLKRDGKGEVQGIYRILLKHPQVQELPVLKAFGKNFQLVEKELNLWCGAARDRLCGLFMHIQEIDPDLPLPFALEEFWIAPFYESAKTLLILLKELALDIHNLMEKAGSIKGLSRRLSGSLGSLEEQLKENVEALEGLFEKTADRVHWGEAIVRVDANGDPVLENGKWAWTAEFYDTPLDIAAWLQARVNPAFKHRCYLSATMSMDGDFDTIIELLGLQTDNEAKKAVTGIYPSPFDYRKQALLGVPHDMPLADPRLRVDPLYMESQSKHLAELARVNCGRMLVLFTSRLIMKEMQPRLQARLSNDGITVLSQANANLAALVDRLREANRKPERIVLLGLRAFWEGVDVPGEALSVLSITRLPFKYHGHPLEQAKKRFYEAGGFDRDYFRDRVVSEVYLHLRQMYGRLIRAETDRGATVITDPRVYVRQYGRNLLQRLPKSTTVVDAGDNIVEAVRCFLAGEEVPAAYHWGELPAVAMGLSPEQRAIVECPSRRILVRAAAGSGKTHVLISRLISLIERKQAKAEEVLALTFTNKAMNVMYERIEAALGGGEAYHMHRNVLTYHKLAMRIIRQDDMEKGMETGFLDENNPQLQEQLFEQARQAAGLTKQTLNDEDARTMIAYGQNGLVNEAELEVKIKEWFGDRALLAKLGRFFLTYIRLIREKGLIDYGEAIVKAVKILRENPDQAAKWSNRFKWIFCDEYQDTSPAQATLLQLLGQQANLFVVGDNAQSIYSWQGSDPDNLRRFELDFPNTATFNLSKNYRCFPKLVRMSSRFLERTGQAYGIRVEYDQKRSTEEQNVFFLHNETDKDEAGAVIGLAKEALELPIPGDPPPLPTVGVLARKWDLLEEIEIHLLKQGIPYIFEGETSRGIVANKLVQDLVMRAANIYNQSQSDQELGDTAESRLAMQLREGSIRSAVSLLTATKRAMPGADLEDEAARCFERLCRILGRQDASLISRLFDSIENRPRVVLSTVHSQKGEEFDTVFVIGLEQGNSPHNPPPAHERLLKWRKVVQEMSHATWQAALNPDDLQRLYEDEEKRIFYVAMTRAKYNLVISRAETRYRFGKNRQFEKSEFLDLSNDPKLVSDVYSTYDVKLTAPVSQHAEEGYRSDGRVFETKNQILVRSKSEMLLANEFVARGMYFEYEEPAAGVIDALPDFSFPDYGNVILEHLGLIYDPNYFERWEAKAKKYEEKGIRYFRTGEEEIRHLTNTVDRLQDQFKLLAEQHYGSERLRVIEILEKLRRISQLVIMRPLKSFNQGIFEVEDPQVVAVAICKENFPDGTLTPDAATNQQPPEIDKVQGVEEVIWESKSYDDVSVWLGRVKSE